MKFLSRYHARRAEGVRCTHFKDDAAFLDGGIAYRFWISGEGEKLGRDRLLERCPHPRRPCKQALLSLIQFAQRLVCRRNALLTLPRQLTM